MENPLVLPLGWCIYFCVLSCGIGLMFGFMMGAFKAKQ